MVSCYEISQRRYRKPFTITNVVWYRVVGSQTDPSFTYQVRMDDNVGRTSQLGTVTEDMYVDTDGAR